MKDFSFLALPAVFGLAAGMVYGVAAHYANLPMSLMEHLTPPLTTSSHFYE